MLFDKLIFRKHLEKGESVLFAAHKHWAQFLKPSLRIVFFGFMLPWIFYYAGFKSRLSLILIGAWTFLALIRWLYDFIDWYSDVWLLTNMSIIIVEWHGLFSNTSERAGYEDTEGISFVIKGFWGTVFRYGDVTLKGVSGSQVVMRNARSPKKIELAFMEHQGRYISQRETAHAGGLKQMLSEMVAHHLRHKN